MKIHPAVFTFALAIFMMASSRAQIPGTREAFTHETNANSWAIFDYSDSNYYYPAYDLAGDGVDPDIWFTLTGDYPLDFLATTVSSGGAFTGDYTANQVDAVACDLYVENADVITSGEFFFYSTVTNQYYFSKSYFPDEDGWQPFFVSFFDDPWYVIEGDGYVEINLTPVILTQVTQIGFTVFPEDVSATGLACGIDNFTLFADLKVESPLSITAEDGALGITFPRRPGLSYEIESSPDLTTWTTVKDQIDISGSTPYLFSEPIQPGAKYFLLGIVDKITETPQMAAP